MPQFSSTTLNPAPLATVLIDVAHMGAEPQEEGVRWAFSIVLRGPREPVLPQQIYSVEHEQMGTLICIRRATSNLDFGERQLARR